MVPIDSTIGDTSGTLAYRTGGTEGLRTIQWLDGAGKTASLGTEPAFYLFPKFSPDGSRLGPRIDPQAGDMVRGNG